MVTINQKNKPFEYAIHSDFLIHWTGKDIEGENPTWVNEDKSKTDEPPLATQYIKRLSDILTHGLWMTEEVEQKEKDALFKTPNKFQVPQCCFTELKLSESRKHAKEYGRLGIGVKRYFLFDRFGRPLIYYLKPEKDKLLEACERVFQKGDRHLLQFFKPMNSSLKPQVYDYFSESEWRIIFFEELLNSSVVDPPIVDPRDKSNTEVHKYFQGLSSDQKQRLKYLLPLDGWLSMIIYPSLEVKCKALESDEIRNKIKEVKERHPMKNLENKNWPIELDLDACRNF